MWPLAAAFGAVTATRRALYDAGVLRTQPAVSLSIQRLEDTLGEKLIDRHVQVGKKMRLLEKEPEIAFDSFTSQPASVSSALPLQAAGTAGTEPNQAAKSP